MDLEIDPNKYAITPLEELIIQHQEARKRRRFEMTFGCASSGSGSKNTEANTTSPPPPTAIAPLNLKNLPV
jgi:hypothetical protein